MLFDKLCGIVERAAELRGPVRGQPLPPALIAQLTNLRRVVDEANVFEFPVLPHEGGFRTEVIRENRELLGERFCLPFRTVAVEDKASCIILQDTVPDQKGLVPPRFFVEIYPTYPDPTKYFPRNDDGGVALMEALGYPADAMSVFWGTVFDMQYDDFDVPRVRARCDYGGNMVATKKQVYHFTLGQVLVEDVTSTLENVRIAIEELAFVNMPSRWVVETRTAQSGETARAGRLRRSNQRPKFTTLTPGELRTIFGRPAEEDRQSPVAHERRGHWRLLKSDRFAKSGLKGQHLWIEATWVGETEAVVGGKKYIVRTDV